MTVDDRGEGGGLAYLVRPDDVISGQPHIPFNLLSTKSQVMKFLIAQTISSILNE